MSMRLTHVPFNLLLIPLSIPKTSAQHAMKGKPEIYT